jgi:glycosyltransferase involved in cell wall biosynthesis
VARPSVNALFVNSGLLGQRTFAQFVEEAIVRDSGAIDAVQTVLTDGLTVPERLVRRLLCAKLWPDGFAGVRNLDRARFRAELNAGLLARRRIAHLERQRGRRFDVLHFHRQTTAYASLDRMHETPSIVSIDCTQEIVARKARSRMEWRSYKPSIRRDGEIFAAAKLIIAVSRWAADCVRAEYPECMTEIMVMPNPVQLDLFAPAWVDERYQRAKTPGYKPNVLFVGGDFVRKGGDDLIGAWREGDFSDRANLHIVSDWPIDRARLGPGITQHTGITSYSPRWLEIWRIADIFAQPTREEAFGLVFQEAAAAGLPAIGTNLNAVPELIADGETGLLTARRSRETLIAALDRLLVSADERRTMGARGRLRIMATADPRIYRERLITALRRVSRKPCAA